MASARSKKKQEEEAMLKQACLWVIENDPKAKRKLQKSVETMLLHMGWVHPSVIPVSQEVWEAFQNELVKSQSSTETPTSEN